MDGITVMPVSATVVHRFFEKFEGFAGISYVKGVVLVAVADSYEGQITVLKKQFEER